MEVDLLLCNFNTVLYLERFIKVLNADYEPGVWNLYVQDNGSTDGSKEWLIDNADNLPIKKVELANNVGYAGAINHLASISDSDLLAAVNADTWFTTKHVRQMIRSFEDHLEQAICGPKQMDDNHHIRSGGITWTGRGGPAPVHRGWSQTDPFDIMFKDRVKCWTVSGSIYYVRRTVWDELTNYPPYRKLFPEVTGAFWPTPHYFEETGCSQLAQHLGHEVWYDGTVDTAGHTWHASEPVGTSSQKYFNTSRQIYVEACDEMGIQHEC